jgi:hypothetical protein
MHPLHLIAKPASLSDIAAQSPRATYAIQGVLAWWVVAWAVMIGGGPDEPYVTWGEYFRDTTGLAALWSLVTLVFSLLIGLILWTVVRRADPRTRAHGMAMMFSAIPFALPLLARLPFQIVHRSTGQINPPPAFTRSLVWLVVGSDWWLLAFAGAWIAILVRSSRRLACVAAAPVATA